jgi:hypothetical protein
MEDSEMADYIVRENGKIVATTNDPKIVATIMMYGNGWLEVSYNRKNIIRHRIITDDQKWDNAIQQNDPGAFIESFCEQYRGISKPIPDGIKIRELALMLDRISGAGYYQH